MMYHMHHSTVCSLHAATAQLSRPYTTTQSNIDHRLRKTDLSDSLTNGTMLRAINYHICFAALSKQQHSISSVLLQEGERGVEDYHLF